MNKPIDDSIETPDTTLGARFPRSGEEMAELRRKGAAAAKRMIAFIDASPTPFHAAENVAAQLREDGFRALDERDAWMLAPGDRRYIIRDGGTLIAFVVGARSPAEAGFRIIGAHTDSPNLRVKPQASSEQKGYLQVGVEIYGGVLLHTWLDRDLSLAGRVSHRSQGGNGGNNGIMTSLVDLKRPVARVSNLAIHLNRKVNEGLVLNKQRHMVPMMGMSRRERFDVKGELAAALGIVADNILGYDLSFYDTQKGTLGGLDEEFVFSARLDNLASCYAATEAICGAPDDMESTAVIALYDHEECGSRSAVGAQSTVLADTLQRISLAYPEGQVQAMPRAIANSFLVSADMAHALHPSYGDKHDSDHAPIVNRGLVIKTNVNQSYATTGDSAAFFKSLCEDSGFTPQHFVARNDMPCGSTIGPITAAKLGLKTVDVGAPMLSMHSCREMAGSLDVHLAVVALQQLFR